MQVKAHCSCRRNLRTLIHRGGMQRIQGPFDCKRNDPKGGAQDLLKGLEPSAGLLCVRG